MAYTHQRLTKEPGTFVTFYSYKGGVGRTFALVNVATQLAMWGYRVLCVDWDLEAPGLDSFWGDCYNAMPEESFQKAGLIGLIGQLADHEAVGHQEIDAIVSPYIAGYSANLRFEWKLDILFAGPVHRPEYGHRVTSIDWHRLFKEKELGAKLEVWRGWAKRKYDFVFIDSRTGFSDMGSICTMHLPDILAMVFTTNGQSLAGAVRAASRAVEGKKHYFYSDGKLRVLPLLSRIDRGAQVQSATWIQQTVSNGILDRFYDDWLSTRVAVLDALSATLIPYTLAYTYGESIAVTEERSSFVAEVCQNPSLLTYTVQNVAGLIRHNLGRSAELIYNRQGFIGSAIDVARSPVELYQENDDLLLDRVRKRRPRFEWEEDKDRRLYEILIQKFELLVSEARWADAKTMIDEMNEQRAKMNLPPVASPAQNVEEPYRKLLDGLLRGLV